MTSASFTWAPIEQDPVLCRTTFLLYVALACLGLMVLGTVLEATGTVPAQPAEVVPASGRACEGWQS